MSVDKQLSIYCQQLADKRLVRIRTLLPEKDSQQVFFNSNDYLSISHDKRIAEAYAQAYQRYPSGSGASMVIGGYHANHQALEQRFAQFLNVDGCIICSSGYAANLAVVRLLAEIKAHCIIDKQVHASIYDGITLSGCAYSRYVHNDLSAMTKKILCHPNHAAVFTEGLFSMSGQIAPLAAMSTITKAHATPLIVDEAHSFGVLGAEGRGAVAAHQLTQEEIPLRIIPLGKAFAAQGAIIAGKSEWLHGILQAGRSLIYSTATSPAHAYGLLKTLDIVSQADDRRAHLNELIALFRNHVAVSPFTWRPSPSAIQYLVVGCSARANFYVEKLAQNGFFCSLIRPPTVNAADAGIRFVINYHHTQEHINSLFHCLSALYDC